MLQRVRDLKVQLNNGTLGDDDKDAIAPRSAQIAKEVKNILDDTEFNGKSLFSTGRRSRSRSAPTTTRPSRPAAADLCGDVADRRPRPS